MSTIRLRYPEELDYLRSVESRARLLSATCEALPSPSDFPLTDDEKQLGRRLARYILTGKAPHE